MLSQRNWTTNVTTLTGQGNRYHVFYHDNYYNGLALDNTAVLDGFTITGGNANGSDNYNGADLCDGGGMYNYGCSPTVTNCTFSGNSATGYGGGMENWYCRPGRHELHVQRQLGRLGWRRDGQRGILPGRHELHVHRKLVGNG